MIGDKPIAFKLALPLYPLLLLLLGCALHFYSTMHLSNLMFLDFVMSVAILYV